MRGPSVCAYDKHAEWRLWRRRGRHSLTIHLGRQGNINTAVMSSTFGCHMSYVGGGRGHVVPTHSRPVRSLYSLQKASSFSSASFTSGSVLSSSNQYTRLSFCTTNSTFLAPYDKDKNPEARDNVSFGVLHNCGHWQLDAR